MGDEHGVVVKEGGVGDSVEEAAGVGEVTGGGEGGEEAAGDEGKGGEAEEDEVGVDLLQLASAPALVEEGYVRRWRRR